MIRQRQIAGRVFEMARIKLRYVNEYRDRHGKLRRYVRVPGSRGVQLPGIPGSIEFMAAYQSAIATVAPPPSSSKHVIHGSLAEITAGYFRSASFANLSPSSQKLYRIALKPILEAHGHRLVRELPETAARHIIEGIGVNLTASRNTRPLSCEAACAEWATRQQSGDRDG